MTDSGLAVRAEVFGQVFVLAQHLTRRTNVELEPLGLSTSQWLLLAVISRYRDEAPTLSEAAATYGTSRQNVKQVARQLVDRGYLELRADPADARAIRLHATAKVAASFDGPAARDHEQRLFDTLFEGLDASDVAALEHLLRRWLSNLIPTGSAP
jgi:DNA-binding MarR family transcriptional regulator